MFALLIGGFQGDGAEAGEHTGNTVTHRGVEGRGRLVPIHGYASALAWVLLIVIAAFTAVSFVTSKYWVYYEDDQR